MFVIQLVELPINTFISLSLSLSLRLSTLLPSSRLPANGNRVDKAMKYIFSNKYSSQFHVQYIYPLFIASSLHEPNAIETGRDGHLGFFFTLYRQLCYLHLLTSLSEAIRPYFSNSIDLYSVQCNHFIRFCPQFFLLVFFHQKSTLLLNCQLKPVNC